MNTTDYSKAQGHWILAAMGKKVLRPGGKQLTQDLIKALDILPTDDIAEFAPGLGYTAGLVLKRRPRSYTGIDTAMDAVAKLQKKFTQANTHFVAGNAAATGLAAESKDKIFGEAMLTMQADHRKREIIREAHRLLKKNGCYAIHELGLTPEELAEEEKATIQRDLAVAIKVNARPLTINEWKTLLEEEGFRILSVKTRTMRLLQPLRMVDDEGPLGVLKIIFNLLRNPSARKRIMHMRATFRKHRHHINAVSIIAEKI